MWMQWSQQLPDRNIWQHLAEADGENEEYAEWNRELVESSGYEGMHAIYWDSSWKVTEPNLNTPYLGIIYQGTVDGMRRTDVLVLRYGRGMTRGSLSTVCRQRVMRRGKYDYHVQERDGRWMEKVPGIK